MMAAMVAPLPALQHGDHRRLLRFGGAGFGGLPRVKHVVGTGLSWCVKALRGQNLKL
jgi:hypothetical protein